ncbi:MAG: hypothetical protein R6V10_13185 [bacterium]
MDFQLQRSMAEVAGTNERTGETWKEMYEYHLGTVQSPLPFHRFKMKVRLMNKLLSRDPEKRQMLLDVKSDLLPLTFSLPAPATCARIF